MSDVRLIDANEAKKALTGWDDNPTDEEIEYTIDKLPTVDAVPVVHGRWTFPWTSPECSVCRKTQKWTSKYCPNCGAKMDAKEACP